MSSGEDPMLQFLVGSGLGTLLRSSDHGVVGLREALSCPEVTRIRCPRRKDGDLLWA